MSYTIMLLLQHLIQLLYSLLHLIAVDAMGEYFMEKGLRVLCVYDDLSKHAVAYRQYHFYLEDHQVVKVSR